MARTGRVRSPSSGGHSAGNRSGRRRRRCRGADWQVVRRARHRGRQAAAQVRRASGAALDEFFVLESKPLESIVAATTKGRGADVIFDTVGGPWFEPALKALARRGRQLVIASVG